MIVYDPSEHTEFIKDEVMIQRDSSAKVRSAVWFKKPCNLTEFSEKYGKRWITCREVNRRAAEIRHNGHLNDIL